MGEGDCNPDRRSSVASSSSSCARLSWILLGTSGVILESQLASAVLADYVSKPGVPLWRRRNDFRHIEVIDSAWIKGSTQIWALAFHAGPEDEELQISPPQSFPLPLSRPIYITEFPPKNNYSASVAIGNIGHIMAVKKQRY